MSATICDVIKINCSSDVLSWFTACWVIYPKVFVVVVVVGLGFFSKQLHTALIQNLCNDSNVK